MTTNIKAILAAIIVLALAMWGQQAHNTRTYEAGFEAGKTSIRLQSQNDTLVLLKTTLEEQRANSDDAGVREDKLADALAATNKALTSTRTALSTHLQAQQNTPYSPTTPEGRPNETPPLLGQCVLDSDTVRLLNRARAGIAADGAPSDTRAAAGRDARSGDTAAPAAAAR